MNNTKLNRNATTFSDLHIERLEVIAVLLASMARTAAPSPTNSPICRQRVDLL
jgi:hypothetical protein